MKGTEGCLSIPNAFAEVERAEFVRVSALDAEGKHFEIEAEGLKAVCLQHEIDHLDGMLYPDHLSRLKRDRLYRKFRKSKRWGGGKRRN